MFEINNGKISQFALVLLHCTTLDTRWHMTTLKARALKPNDGPKRNKIPDKMVYIDVHSTPTVFVQ